MAPLLAAWRGVWEARRPLLAWNLSFVALSVFVLAPVASAFLSAGFLQGGDRVVGNLELLEFATTPAGTAWLALSAVFALITGVIRYTGISRIITDRAEGHRATPFRTAVEIAARTRVIAQLCLAAVGGAVLLAAPLVAGLAAVYVTLLGRFDINYYLAVRPPEWTLAIVIAGLWTLLWVAVATVPVGRSLFAVPIALERDVSAWSALRTCWARPRGPSRRAVALVGLSLAVGVIGRLLLDLTVVLASRQAILFTMRLSPWVRPVVAVTGLAGLVSVSVSTVASIAVHSFVCAVVTILHRQELAESSLPTAAGTSKNSMAFAAELTPGASMPPAAARRRLPSGRLRAAYRWLRPRRAGVVLVALFLIGLSAGALLVRAAPEVRAVAVSAHRAGPPPAPENTLSALEAAIAAGAELTEIDVQRAGDGTLVVVHDADLMRVARDPRRVEQLRRDDLAAIIQFPDDGTPPAERRLLALDELLERGSGRIRFMIELKYYGFDPLLTEDVLREVRERDLEDQVVIMSLSRRAVEQVRRVAPEIEVGFVSAVAVGDLGRLPVDFLAVNSRFVTPPLIRRARARGIEVHAWTVNDPAAMAALIVLGIDGLITDEPARAVRVRNEILELSALERVLLRFGIGTVVYDEHPDDDGRESGY